jgi:transposase
VFLPRQRFKLARVANDKECTMSQTPKIVGIDIGKNSFHVVGHDERGAIVLRQKWSAVSWKHGLPTCRRV